MNKELKDIESLSLSNIIKENKVEEVLKNNSEKERLLESNIV